MTYLINDIDISNLLKAQEEKFELFREAGAAGLISNPKVWFNFIKIRNLTVHTYNEQNVEQVISSFDNFSESLKEFLENLERFDDQS